MAFPAFKLAALSLSVISLATATRTGWVVRETLLMGTTLSLSVEAGTREAGIRATDAALRQVRVLDDLVNDWRPESQLSRVNRAAPGRWHPISPDLFALLQEVELWSRQTGRAFDPAIGSLIDAWGLRASGKVPDADELESARMASGLAGVQLDPSTTTIRRGFSGSWIDAGGFGKGAALRAALQVLRSPPVTRAVLNFGGQVAVLGDTTLVIDVAHPSRRFQPVAQLALRHASASTSGQSERYVELNGERFGHILDPASGRPVRSWGSVTVIHPDPMAADILSTALFVMGPDRGMQWLQGKNIAALFLISNGDDLETRWSQAMSSLLISTISKSGE